MLRAWAEDLLSLTADPGDLDLRVADVLGVAAAGLGTAEGRRLAAWYGPDPRSHAALVAGLARLTECEDIHLASCVTPGSTAIPVALALSAEADTAAVGRFGPAVAAGYAAGIRLGLAVGGPRALEVGVWPTVLCAPFMAAVTAAVLRGADAPTLAQAMGHALAGRSGRVGRAGGEATNRWLTFAQSVGAGIEAAAAAFAGFRADTALMSPDWLAAQVGGGRANPGALDLAAVRPRMEDAGFKPFATARQGATAIAALRDLIAEGLDPAGIERILVEVPAASVALLARPVAPDDRFGTMANIGWQLAAVALDPDRLFDVERTASVPAALLALAERVEVRPADDLSAQWPRLWPARLTVQAAGRAWHHQVAALDTDRGAAAAAPAVREKLRRLALHAPVDALLAPGGGLDPDRRRAVWTRLITACQLCREETARHAYH